MVGRVSCFALAGLDLWFNSADHLPAHFHAEKPGEWEVRVHFLRAPDDMIETKWTMRPGRPSRGDLRELVAHAGANRVALLAEWHEKVNIAPPGGRR